jgi:putative transposase
MPRAGRITIPEALHHITQRGNNRQDLFFTDEDRRAYLGLLAEQASTHGLAVLGYCLMDNHVHLVAAPQRVESLAKAVGRTHFLYTQHFNRRYGRSGHLWQGRFYSCALDDDYAWAALDYVERNPGRAGLARYPWRYQWSSAAAHCGLGEAHEVLDLQCWGAVWTPEEWRARLHRPPDEASVRALRAHTGTGRPLGSEAFLDQIELALGRRVRALPVGRPRRRVANTSE